MRTLEEQTNSLANYMPLGRAFGAKSISGTVTRALLEGFAGELIRNEALIAEFRDEILPDETILFISEWERAVGIPDACFTGKGTDDERRSDILAKLAALGVQTAEDMRLLALRIYGLEITITTPEIPSTSVFPLVFPHTFEGSDKESRFTLLINYDNLPEVERFPLTFPILFGTRDQATLECVIARQKPANVKIGSIIGVPVSPPIPIGFIPGAGKSLEFDETVPQYLTGPVNSDFDVDNNFSVMCWAKNLSGLDLTRRVFCLGHITGDQNHIWIGFDWSFFRRMGIDILDAATGNQKVYRSFQLLDNIWYQLVATWNGVGNTLKIYINGSEDAAPFKSEDDAISLSRTPMTPTIGAKITSTGNTLQEFNGRIHQASLWNTVLSDAEITAIYNSGNGDAFNLLLDQGNYASASSLKYWYAPGMYASPQLGVDLSKSGDLIDITTENSIGDADRRNDAPV